MFWTCKKQHASAVTWRIWRPKQAKKWAQKMPSLIPFGRVASPPASRASCMITSTARQWVRAPQLSWGGTTRDRASEGVVAVATVVSLEVRSSECVRGVAGDLGLRCALRSRRGAAQSN